MLKSEVGDVLDGCVDFRGWWTLVHQDQWISPGFSKVWIGWLFQDLVGWFFQWFGSVGFFRIWSAFSKDRIGWFFQWFGSVGFLRIWSAFSVVWIGWFFVDLVDFLRIGFFGIKLNG